MKIAVSSTGRTIDDNVHPLFGRCDFILIVDTESSEIKALQNVFAQLATGSGTGCAAMLFEHNVTAVISGQVGPNAYEVLKAAGVSMYNAPPGVSVHEALEKFKAGSLQKNELRRY